MRCRRKFLDGMTIANFLYYVSTALLFVLAVKVQGQQQDPFEINGGSILAMTGKDSVAVAVDKRFGSGPQVSIKTMST